VKIPEIGTSLGKYCDPVTKNMMDRIADGRGGSKSEIVSINDPACGYVKPQEAGTKLFEFCSGVNMMARYADGKGGFNDVPILINTVKCNGENFETPGTGGTNPGGTSKAKIALSSTHTKLYKGTFEVMVIAFSGLQPNTQYEASLWVEDNAIFALEVPPGLVPPVPEVSKFSPLHLTVLMRIGTSLNPPFPSA
jgi:hypothetical protein